MAVAKYTRGKDGYFSTLVWDGTYTDTGKKHRVHLRSRKSSRDLEKKVAAMEAAVKDRKYITPDTITLLEYARQWKSIYKYRESNNTKKMYDRIIEVYFSTQSVRLQDVSRMHLELLLNAADGKARTQQQILMTFKQVLRSAVLDNLFPANVADDILRNVKPIKYKPSEKRALHPWERDAIFAADFQDMDRAFVFIIYGCGLRRGEALALAPADVNLEARTLTVNKSLEFLKNDSAIKEPKSQHGYRTVPLPDCIVDAVSDYMASLPPDAKFIFALRNGDRMTHSAYVKMWRRITNAIAAATGEDVTGLTAHVFRHNYCSSLCYQIPTVSIKRIAQLLGDTDQMVLNVYNHIMLENEDAQSAVNCAFGTGTKMEH